jgi:hypothetical protein
MGCGLCVTRSGVHRVLDIRHCNLSGWAEGGAITGSSFGVHVIVDKTAQQMIWFRRVARIAQNRQ